MNVLKSIIIPRIDLSIRYILSELEEREREDVFRLKIVKAKKTSKANRLDKEKSVKADPVEILDSKEDGLEAEAESILSFEKFEEMGVTSYQEFANE